MVTLLSLLISAVSIYAVPLPVALIPQWFSRINLTVPFWTIDFDHNHSDMSSDQQCIWCRNVGIMKLSFFWCTKVRNHRSQKWCTESSHFYDKEQALITKWLVLICGSVLFIFRRKSSQENIPFSSNLHEVSVYYLKFGNFDFLIHELQQPLVCAHSLKENKHQKTPLIAYVRWPCLVTLKPNSSSSRHYFIPTILLSL